MLNENKYEPLSVRLGRILFNHGLITVPGLNIQSLLLVMGLATGVICTQALEGKQAFARAKGSDISVKAVVPLRAHLTILFQTPSLRLTDADIERGYVEIRAATRLAIKNNNKAGYILIFEGLGRPFKEVLISGLLRDVQINASGAFIYQAYTKNAVTAELSYRFVLFEDARAGEYAWPISLSLQPAP